MLKCPYCEAPLEAGLSECPNCHETICYVEQNTSGASQTASEAAEPVYSEPKKVQFVKKSSEGLSNGLKVFLSVLSAVFGIGQLITFIASIVFMCSADKDRSSFGLCLMIATVIMFILTLVTVIALVVFFSLNWFTTPYPSYYGW